MAKQRSGLGATTLDSSRPASTQPGRPALYITFAGGSITTGNVLPLTGEVIAGREAPSGGWMLDDDVEASRHHARVRVENERVFIEDLGSRNGVWVNGTRLESAELRDRDVLRIGATFAVLRFENPHELDVGSERLLGQSLEMRRTRVDVRRVANGDAGVLLLGESGTGKEVVATEIHDLSRRSGRYVAVNCAGVQATLFESELFGHEVGAFTGATRAAQGYFRAAADGTLLLDEVGDMPSMLHAKLLRALDTKSVVPVGATVAIPHRARIVAATNRDLARQVADGLFRADLYARLAQLVITLAPLRDRREDILMLLRHLYPDAPPLAPSLVEALLLYRWPLNVRELASIATELRSRGHGLSRLTLDLVAERIARPPGSSREDPRPAPPRRSLGSPVDRAELERLLSTHAGNVTAIAREIGRSRTQVYRLLEHHRLETTAYRTSSPPDDDP